MRQPLNLSGPALPWLVPGPLIVVLLFNAFFVVRSNQMAAIH